MTSVARKTHIPKAAVWCCCSRFAYCSSSKRREKMVWSSISRSAGVSRVLSGLILGLFQMVLIRFADHDGALVKVVLRRRRGGLPLQPGGAPRIGAGRLSVAQR